MDPFADPEAVARYAENPPRLVPGFADLQRMAWLLLAERVPDDGAVLVVGAGGGLELRVFAEARPGWRFDGIDPAPAMLDLARRTLGPLAQRVRLHEGTVETAPAGPFDGATCLLVLHFLAPDERRRTLAGIRRRLRPGAPLVVAHHSFPQDEREAWLSRFCAFAAASGIDAQAARLAGETVGGHLPILAPAADEALMQEAGFGNVTPFYAAFTFRGWVAEAA